jgi:hypothetical protein
VTNSSTFSSGQYTVTMPITGPKRFFRLRNK